MMLLSNTIALSLAQAGMGDMLTLGAGNSKTVPVVITIFLVLGVAVVSLIGSKRGHQD